MKKLLTILALPVLSFASVGTVAAQGNINNTGPGSNNQVTNNRTSNFVCVNNNNANVKSNNNQSSNSGSANNSGNTNGGGATSGSASNRNSSNTNISVNNGCPTGTRAVAAGSVEAKGAGGGVAPAGQGSVAPNARVDAQGHVLPATGVDGTVKAAGIAVASLAGLAGVTAAGTSLYRRRALN